MKKVLLLTISSIFILSCGDNQSEVTSKKYTETSLAPTHTEAPQHEGLSELDLLFNQLSDSLIAFVGVYNNWGDSYVWESNNTADKPFNDVRLSGAQVLKDYLIIERRNLLDTKNTPVISYGIEKLKNSYQIETTHYKKGEKVNSETMPISTPEEMKVAQEIFYKRLEEAKQDVKENVKRIKELQKRG